MSAGVDLSEPWRYACPECGSVTIKRNAGRVKAPTLRVDKKYGGRGELENFRPPREYHCNECGEAFDRPVDRKEASHA